MIVTCGFCATSRNPVTRSRARPMGTFVTLSNQTAVPFQLMIRHSSAIQQNGSVTKPKLGRDAEPYGKKRSENARSRTKMVVGQGSVRNGRQQIYRHTLDISSVGRRSARLREWIRPAACFDSTPSHRSMLRHFLQIGPQSSDWC